MESLFIFVSIILIVAPFVSEFVCVSGVFYPYNDACSTLPLSPIFSFISSIEPYLFIPALLLAWFFFKKSNHIVLGKIMGIALVVLSVWSLLYLLSRMLGSF